MKPAIEQTWQRWFASLRSTATSVPASMRAPSADQIYAASNQLAYSQYESRHPNVHQFLDWCQRRRKLVNDWRSLLSVLLTTGPEMLARRHRRHLVRAMRSSAMAASEEVYWRLEAQYISEMRSLVERAHRLDGLLNEKWRWIERALWKECVLMREMRDPSTTQRRHIVELLEAFAEERLNETIAVSRAREAVSPVLAELLQEASKYQTTTPYIANGAHALATRLVDSAKRGDLSTNLDSCALPLNMKERDSWLVLWTALAASIDFAREKSMLNEAETALFVAWLEKWQSRMANWPQEVADLLEVKSPGDFGTFRLTTADKGAERRTGADGILIIWDRRQGKSTCRAISIQAKVSNSRTLSVERAGWRQFDTLAQTAQAHWSAVYLGFTRSLDPLVMTAGVPFKVARVQLEKNRENATRNTPVSKASDYALEWPSCGQPFATALVETLFDSATPQFESPGAALQTIADSTGIKVWDFLLIQGIGINAMSIERAITQDLNLLKHLGFDVARLEVLRHQYEHDRRLKPSGHDRERRI